MNRQTIVTGVIAAVVACAATAALPSACARFKGPAPDSGMSREKAAWAKPTASAPLTESAMTAIAERAMPSVVSVASTRVARLETPALPFDHPLFRHFFGPDARPDGDAPFPFQVPPGHAPEQRGLGSGVIVGKDLILTNAHVVEGADQIEVTGQGKRVINAKLVGSDPKSDLAVLRIQGEPAGVQSLELADSSRIRLGQIVLAIGNPFGVGQTVTMGIISAKGRADLGIVDYEDFIQTDAAINPGNSGGALVDMDGKLIGIPTAILSRTGGYMGLGFAIPSNMAKPIMASLIEHGRVTRGYLGVTIQELDQTLAKAPGTTHYGWRAHLGCQSWQPSRQRRTETR